MNRSVTNHAPILVVGAGSWGTALAIHLANNHNTVRMWGIETSEMQVMAEQRINPFYLPDYPFPESLQAFVELEQAIEGVDDILIVVPSHGFASTLATLHPYLTSNSCIAWATKGLDPTSGDLLADLAKRELGDDYPLAVIAGPSFAKEVAQGLPTAVTIAANNETFASDLITRFSSDTFRPYLNKDIVGVAICGAVKNPIALAAGISDGLGYGANARCALITRALAEMTRLGLALGGDAATFTGLAGLGDLVLTCTDNQSRNRRFGLAIGQGKSFDQAAAEIGQVVEGRGNAPLVRQMAKRVNVSMPIIECVCDVLDGKLAPQQAVTALFSREIKAEA